MANPEGFYLFLAIVIPVIWWEYRKYKLRNIKSYKVAYIMENERYYANKKHYTWND